MALFRRNRFAKRNRDWFIVKDVIFPAALILGALFLMSSGMDALSQRTEAERLDSAKNAVTRAAVQCYALEGRYPLSLSYLKENYGLRVDEDKYIVHYQAFASNIMPDIYVLARDMSATSADYEEDDLGDFDWQDDLP